MVAPPLAAGATCSTNLGRKAPCRRARRSKGVRNHFGCGPSPVRSHRRAIARSEASPPTALGSWRQAATVRSKAGAQAAARRGRRGARGWRRAPRPAAPALPRWRCCVGAAQPSRLGWPFGPKLRSLPERRMHATGGEPRAESERASRPRAGAAAAASRRPLERGAARQGRWDWPSISQQPSGDEWLRVCCVRIRVP